MREEGLRERNDREKERGVSKREKEGEWKN